MSDSLPLAATSSTFESIKRTNASGAEYWSARDLARVLEYSDFRNFSTVVSKAAEACRQSGRSVSDHFVEITEMVEIGSGAQRKVEDWALSRYACYLVIQNADPSKPVVALGQTYFAVQTRRQELADDEVVQEDGKRLHLREEMKKHNKKLAGAAKQAGVIQPQDCAVFMDHGYRGLYGGLGSHDIQARKRLTSKQQILDHMGAPSWRRISSKPRKRRINCAERMCAQGRRQSSARIGWSQGAAHYRRTRWHDAGKLADGGEHQASGAPRKEAAKR